ncbi:MAG: NTE family protein [Paracrocinitomix sp.]
MSGDLAVVEQGSLRRAWTVLAIASASTFLFVLDAGFLSVSFPSIEKNFADSDRSALAWVSIVYFVTGSPALLVGASFGDKWGRSRVFVTGLCLFALGAIATALATSVPGLIVARSIGGIGVGLLGAMSLALVLPEFPEHRRGQAIGAWGGVGALAAVLAPTCGAVIVESFGWRAPFALLGPIAFGAAMVGWRVLPKVKVAERSELDVPGLTALAAATASLAALVSLGNEWGWTSRGALALMMIVPAGLGLFGVASRRRPRAVLDRALLANRDWVAGTIGAGIQQFGFLAMFFSTPLIIVNIWDWSVVEAGIGMSVAMVVSTVVGPIGGRYADVRGDRLLIIVGAVIFAAGMFWWRLFIDETPSVFHFGVGAVLVGFGGSLCGSLTTSAALRYVEVDLMAVSSAALSTLRRLCAGIGIAIAIVLLGEAEGPELLDGARRVWAFVGLVTLAMIPPTLFLRR